MTEYTPTVPEVVDKLQALGSPRQIADFFASEGVLGWPGMRTACPLANYLRRETDVAIAVGTTYITVVMSWPPDRIDTTETPIQDFVMGFDFGQYPELIEAGSE
jgi:hypothetical protein